MVSNYLARPKGRLEDVVRYRDLNGLYYYPFSSSPFLGPGLPPLSYS